MRDLIISKYLEKINNNNKVGKCHACQKQFQWAKDRLANHKRALCPRATIEEKRLFARRNSDILLDTPDNF